MTMHFLTPPQTLFWTISENPDSAYIAFTVNSKAKRDINKLTFQQLDFLVNQDLVNLKF